VTEPVRFLLTNDDGIDAPGLEALERALTSLGSRMTVAPLEHLSGCSHQVTTRRPLELKKLNDRRHSIDGTPVDCTRVGLVHLAEEMDWVVAGINLGGNLGADVYMSGTVAAVREAALLGKPGIAISQYRRSRTPVNWEVAARWAQEVVRQLVTPLPAPGTFWNVNLPHCDETDRMPEIVFCPLDPNPMPVHFVADEGKLHYRGVYQDRPQHDGCDVQVCFSGQISVTELSLG
jgi:5'-nucleotidase